MRGNPHTPFGKRPTEKTSPTAPRRRSTSLDGRGLETERDSVPAPVPDPTILTELTTISGARTWCGHGVLAHNLGKIGALTG